MASRISRHPARQVAICNGLGRVSSQISGVRATNSTMAHSRAMLVSRTKAPEASSVSSRM
ncbi:hypothetical protein D3C78_1711150 [compost metagenome]